MPESPCVDCGEMCLHTDEDEEPRCEDCTEYQAAKRLILDIANGVVTVPPDFSFGYGPDDDKP